MALESGTYINSLNASNPASTDGLGQADDHLRLIKSTIKATFPNLDGAVTATVANLNSTTSIPTTLTDLGISDGTNGQVLQTDGSGNFSFFTLPAGTTDTNYYLSGGSYSNGSLSLTVTGASNVTVTGFPTNTSDLTNNSGFLTSVSTSSVRSATAGMGADDIGSYALLHAVDTTFDSNSTDVLEAGDTLSGTYLRFANALSDVNETRWAGIATTGNISAPGGTWRCMGNVGYLKDQNDTFYTDTSGGHRELARTTLWLRIS